MRTVKTRKHAGLEPEKKHFCFKRIKKRKIQKKRKKKKNSRNQKTSFSLKLKIYYSLLKDKKVNKVISLIMILNCCSRRYWRSIRIEKKIPSRSKRLKQCWRVTSIIMDLSELLFKLIIL